MDIQVLMSVYNGEKYLLDQLISLKNQKEVMLKILIRDDGSTDRSLAKMFEFARKTDIEVSIFSGPNIGVIASFFELLKTSDNNVQYYAFCDQDDVWHSDKLYRAILLMKHIPAHIPAMYCSRTELVDDNYSHLAYWPQLPKKGPSFNNALIENIAVGCTIVINHTARDLILRELPDTSRIIMHDWWIYLCVSAFGEVVYDPEPHILYRQHNSNLIGGARGTFDKWSKKLRSFIRNYNKYLLRKQAEEFYKLYGNDLSDEKRKILNSFLNNNQNFYKRLMYSCTTKLYRQNSIEDLLFRIMYLFNRI